MAIATPDLYAETPCRPRSEKGFAYPAVNVTSSQTLNAAIRGFAEAGSDGIIQVIHRWCSILVRRLREGHGRWLPGLRSLRTRSC